MKWGKQFLINVSIMYVSTFRRKNENFLYSIFFNIDYSNFILSIKIKEDIIAVWNTSYWIRFGSNSIFNSIQFQHVFFFFNYNKQLISQYNNKC